MDTSNEKLKSKKCMICNRALTYIACPYCGGISHKNEFLEWLKVKKICPRCRLPIQVIHDNDEVILKKFKEIGSTLLEIKEKGESIHEKDKVILKKIEENRSALLKINKTEEIINEFDSENIVIQKRNVLDVIKRFDESAGVSYNTISSKINTKQDNLEDILLILKIEGSITEIAPLFYQYIGRNVSTTPSYHRCISCDFRLSPKAIKNGENICASCKGR